MSFTKEIIDKLNKVIGSKVITQRELAKRIGVNRATLVGWRQGLSFPRKKTLDKLEFILNNIIKIIEVLDRGENNDFK